VVQIWKGVTGLSLRRNWTLFFSHQNLKTPHHGKGEELLTGHYSVCATEIKVLGLWVVFQFQNQIGKSATAWKYVVLSNYCTQTCDMPQFFFFIALSTIFFLSSKGQA
jgi:hypothetical protein